MDERVVSEWRDDDGKVVCDIVTKDAQDHSPDSGDEWLTWNVPGEPLRLGTPIKPDIYRCPDCGREGQNCLDVRFYRTAPDPERESARYCMDCLWALAEKHLTPLKEKHDA